MLFITDTTTASANTERMFASEYLTATTGARHPDTHYNERLPIPFPMQSQKEEMIVTDSNNNEQGVAIGNTARRKGSFYRQFKYDPAEASNKFAGGKVWQKIILATARAEEKFIETTCT